VHQSNCVRDTNAVLICKHLLPSYNLYCLGDMFDVKLLSHTCANKKLKEHIDAIQRYTYSSCGNVTRLHRHPYTLVASL
jgi:hypothetical protein